MDPLAVRLEPLYNWLLKDHHETLKLLFHLADLNFNGGISESIHQLPILSLSTNRIASVQRSEDELSEWSEDNDVAVETEKITVELRQKFIQPPTQSLDSVRHAIEFQMESLRLSQRRERFEDSARRRSRSPERVIALKSFVLTDPCSLVPAIYWKANQRDHNPLHIPREGLFQSEQELAVDSLFALALFPPQRQHPKLLKHVTESGVLSFNRLIERYVRMHREINERYLT
jgi:hypothetical protein